MKSAKMVSILQIDGLGKRYGMLPSEIIKRGDTFDLYIMDAAMSFERYHQQKELNNGKPPVPNYSTDQLLEILHKNKPK
jgi:hypothetical protein